MRLPLHFDADLVTFLDRAYSAASIAAPGVAVHERIANLRRALHEQYRRAPLARQPLPPLAAQGTAQLQADRRARRAVYLRPLRRPDGGYG